MFDDAKPPINLTALADAARIVRRTLERAERGDREAQDTLLRMSVADDLESTLRRVTAHAKRVAPSLDELKVDPSIASEARALRHEIDLVDNILNQAAGRATVVALPVARATQGESPASGDAA